MTQGYPPYDPLFHSSIVSNGKDLWAGHTNQVLTLDDAQIYACVRESNGYNPEDVIGEFGLPCDTSDEVVYVFMQDKMEGRV